VARICEVSSEEIVFNYVSARDEASLVAVDKEGYEWLNTVSEKFCDGLDGAILQRDWSKGIR
jgi:hypothetical protein